jgi:hypothetical protein
MSNKAFRAAEVNAFDILHSLFDILLFENHLFHTHKVQDFPCKYLTAGFEDLRGRLARGSLEFKEKMKRWVGKVSKEDGRSSLGLCRAI